MHSERHGHIEYIPTGCYIERSRLKHESALKPGFLFPLSFFSSSSTSTVFCLLFVLGDFFFHGCVLCPWWMTTELNN